MTSATAQRVSSSPPDPCGSRPSRARGLLRAEPTSTLQSCASAHPRTQTDPALAPDPQIAYATCAKLLNYPAASAPRGTRLVPEVAAALPTRSADGRTYTFTVRDGFAFSPPTGGARDRFQTFRHALERSLHPKMDPGGTSVLADIAGVDAYRSGKASRIAGIAVAGNRLLITLADRSRLFRPGSLRLPRAPFLNTPIDPKGLLKIPSAGKYFVAEHLPNRRLVSSGTPTTTGRAPAASARSIHFASPREQRRGRARGTIGLRRRQSTRRRGCGAARPLRPGERPRAHRTTAVLREPDPQARVPRAEHEPAAVLGRPPAKSGQLRDRPSGARTDRERGLGPFVSVPTDQYLPPTMPGASPTVIYPPNGDLRTARRLAPDAHGTTVLYTCDEDPPLCRRPAQQIKENLAALGLDVDIREFPSGELDMSAQEREGSRSTCSSRNGERTTPIPRIS